MFTTYMPSTYICYVYRSDTHMYILIYIYIYICMCICIYIYIYINMHVYIHIWIHDICICICIYIYIYLYICSWHIAKSIISLYSISIILPLLYPLLGPSLLISACVGWAPSSEDAPSQSSEASEDSLSFRCLMRTFSFGLRGVVRSSIGNQCAIGNKQYIYVYTHVYIYMCEQSLLFIYRYNI